MPGVELLFGPMLIGVTLNMMLYGTMFTQMISYYQRYTDDSRWIRFFMLYLLIVQTANVFVEFGIVYQPLIINFGSPLAVAKIPTLLPGDSILITIVSAPIQLFTAWRISVITGSYILPAIISLLSFGSFAAGVTVSFMVATHPEFQLFGKFTNEVIVWLSLSAVCDIVIAIGMSHALYTRKTGFTQVDGQINRIIRMTVETGALTAFTALADVAIFLTLPATAMNFIVDFPLSNLYTCSLLAMLNSRKRRKNTDIELSGSSAHMSTSHTRSQNTTRPGPPPSFQSHSKMMQHSEPVTNFFPPYGRRQLIFPR
ncbi:hypothetical protein DFH06DRAFT_461667 [Mycena polygramma]|nr:hypothetical protein DFH06DRAFT_461667 [Mycena polygramma]